MENMREQGGREGALRFFRTLAEAGSLSSAAIALNLSVSSVSKQLKALEQRLGILLVKRNAHSFSLTDAGQYYYEHAVNMTSRLAAVERHLQEMARTHAGLLTVGVPEGVFESMLMEPFRLFMQAYPDIRLSLVNTGHGASLNEDRLDCQILRIDPDDLSSHMTRVELFPSRLVLCASPDYLATHGQPDSPRDLPAFDCLAVMNKTGRLLNNWRFRNGRRRLSLTVTPRFSGLGWQVRQMAATGLGIARVPEHLLLANHGAPRLTRVLPQWEDPDRRVVSLLYLGEENPPARVALFARFLRRHFSQKEAAPHPGR